MIIFSERINGMYRDVRGAIAEKNKSVVHDLLRGGWLDTSFEQPGLGR